MHNIGDGLKSDLGAVKGAPTCSGPWRKHTIAALLPFQALLGLIRGATGLIEYLLNFRAKSAHRRSLSRFRRALEKSFPASLPDCIARQSWFESPRNASGKIKPCVNG
jgi:hypothetical protein